MIAGGKGATDDEKAMKHFSDKSDATPREQKHILR